MDSLFEKEESLVLSIVLGLCLLLFISMVFILFLFYSKKRISQGKLNNHRLQIKHQSELIHHNIEAVEKERTRIAKDLHDDICSGINLVAINLHQIRSEVHSNTQVVKLSDKILTLTDQLLESTRNLSYELMPPVLEKFGLFTAIEDLIDSYSTNNKVKITFDNHIKMEDNILTSFQEINVYRVFQELLSNSIKHGNATHLTLSICHCTHYFVFHYKDNGIGFDLEGIKLKGKGMGLMNIENRVKMANGEMDINSSKNKGISVSLKIPKQYEHTNN